MTDDLPIVKNMKMVRESDLVYRLRTCADIDDVHDAADRIEALEAALRKIADGAVADNADDACYALMKMARKALEGKDD